MMTPAPAAPSAASVPTAGRAGPLYRTLGSARRRSPAAPPVARTVLEALEGRTLMTVAVGVPISSTIGVPNGPSTAVDLKTAFNETDLNGTIVRFATSVGNIDLELFDKAAQRTVQNFVNYVANNLYDGTVIHRSDPDFVIQGGGYFNNGAHIAQDSPVPNEFSKTRSNVRGTIAMAKLPATDGNGSPVPGGGPDSATSEWFINLGDNSSTLDAQNGGYAVFGRVVNNTLATVDSIASLPVYNATVVSPVFAELPVRNAVPDGTAPAAQDYVYVGTAAVVPEISLLNVTAASDRPDIVNTLVNPDGTLSLFYGGTVGTARVTVTATNPTTGSTASQTFVAGNGELAVQIGSGGVGNSVAFTEADGGTGSISISKGASALVRFTGTGLAIAPGKKPGLSGTVSTIAGIEGIDTGTGTTLTIKIKGGDGAIDVGGLTTTTPLKGLAFKQTRLTGAVTVGGTLKTLALGDVANAAIVVGGSAADRVSMVVTAGTATDVSLTSGVPIKSVKATAFASTGTVKAITAPAVTSVAVTGAFQESVVTTSAIKSIKAGGAQKGNISGTTLGGLSAASLDGGIFNLTAGGKTVGKVAVPGAITNTTIRSGGDILSVAAASINSARFYAGADVPDEEFPPFLPASAAQFTAPARIGSVTVLTATDGLSIAATSIGKLVLGKVATDGPIPFGVAALTVDALAGGTADTEEGPGVPFAFANLDDQAAFDQQATGVPLGNFVVRLF
jgi:cyclophilin family peptidyl-prolyl cis-trans isomerase